ncbi:MAG: class I SAM-dependent methyltransferase [Burkholderiaceae bacterium]|jgi:2-polyprenyl-3-methyl-5-hydroxy-6-metoxy-1,4-benzoquinol methylase
MSLGERVRRVLGRRLSFVVGRWYRAIFVDLGLEARALSTTFPDGAHVLDIGGGDGEPLNHLLRLRPDLQITTIDPGPEVGQWLASEYQAQVTRLPRTGLEDYLAAGQPSPDALLIADVLHHIPEAGRGRFLGSVNQLLERLPNLRIVVKDVEPGSLRARLGYWSDRYITGDRSVSLVSRAHLIHIFGEALGPLRHDETDLFVHDKPNYAIVFYR